MSEKHIGKVIQVIGPVLDIQFKDGELPELLNCWTSSSRMASCRTCSTPLRSTTTARSWWWRSLSSPATMWPAALP